MTIPSPIRTLIGPDGGDEIPLTDELSRLYGRFSFPPGRKKPYIISNFVSTIDGVVTLGIPGKEGGDAISGKNRHDAAVMGILRAVSDAVIVGSANLAASAKHIWTAERVFPDLAAEYVEVRKRLQKSPTPLNVIVTANVRIDLTLPIFQSGKVDVLIVTTATGAAAIDRSKLPRWVSVAAAGSGPLLTAAEIIAAVMRARHDADILLVEGGPHLMGTFFGDKALDELFITISPQVAGRAHSPERLGLVEARLLAPDNPAWGRLIDVRKADEHLFLRYAFGRL